MISVQTAGRISTELEVLRSMVHETVSNDPVPPTPPLAWCILNSATERLWKACHENNLEEIRSRALEVAALAIHLASSTDRRKTLRIAP